MKFHNEQKEIRRTWPTAMSPRSGDIKAAHAWCVWQPSTGRFYHHYTNTRWWFENEVDATFFALKWGSKSD